MKMKFRYLTGQKICLLASISTLIFLQNEVSLMAQDPEIPHLTQQGTKTQIIVDGQPFIILGGELGNSTFTGVDYMRPVWPKLTAMNLNTVLAPVFWELIEPEQGKFDFQLLDELINEARGHHLKLVLLWFGSWKNSMSSHAPAWVKTDQKTYPRVKDEQGIIQDILAPFSENNLRADRNAFKALMKHLKEMDRMKQTIIMLQVENEIGMLPSARDHSKQANEIAIAGKEVYPIPMYVNAPLNTRNRKPGEYPSGGPLPHLMDIWKAGAASIDFLSPDFYDPVFKQYSDLYVRQENPLFIPEHRFDHTVAAKAAYAIGHYEALGFAPFSIESTNDPENEPLGKMYNLIHQLTPLITAKKGTGRLEGVLLDKESGSSIVNFGEYELTINHSHHLGWEPAAINEAWELAGAIIIQAADNEFYVAGDGIYITFKNLKNSNRRVGILKTEEGIFEDNTWKVIRHLNGDQTHQGRHIRIFKENYSILRFELYNYE
jgi:hypothetical protein